MIRPILPEGVPLLQRFALRLFFPMFLPDLPVAHQFRVSIKRLHENVLPRAAPIEAIWLIGYDTVNMLHKML